MVSNDVKNFDILATS